MNRWYPGPARSGAGADREGRHRSGKTRSRLFLVTLPWLLYVLMACGSPSPDAPPATDMGSLAFSSNHEALNQGFDWAKKQALDYAFQGDPVGMWFEAALPGREAFCMRDVSHQAMGAMALGLQAHTKNMFRKFSEAISPSRDWASYWEINRYDQPAPVDYRSDEDFWYNLPANFDLIRAMVQVYEWTGDPAYLQDPTFLAFYRHSLTDYVEAWDPDGDGLMESPPENGIRGIPTYWEGDGPRAETGGDLVAAQVAANEAFAKVLRWRGEGESARPFEAEADRLRRSYNDDWWNPETGRFNTAILPDGSFDESLLPLGQIYPLYFGIIDDGPRLEQIVRGLPDGEMVELNAYVPEIFYRHGDHQRGFRALMDQLDPELPRREYPEVSYTAVGHIVTMLMGVNPVASEGVLETKPRLTDPVRWGELKHLPVMSNKIHLRHDGNTHSTLSNEAGPPLTWRATFPGPHAYLLVDGEERVATIRGNPKEGDESWVEVSVPPGRRVAVEVGGESR